MIKQTMWNCVFLWPCKQTLMISDREHSINQGSERARLAISAAAAASSGAAAANWGIRGGEDITGRRKHWHLYGNVKLSEKNLSVFLSHTHTHLMLSGPLFTEPSAILSSLAPPIVAAAHFVSRCTCSTARSRCTVKYSVLGSDEDILFH